MTGMTPADWDQLVNNFNKNDTLFQDFCHNFNKRAPCDSDCKPENKAKILCELRSSKSADLSKCKSQKENQMPQDFKEKKRPRSFHKEL